MAPEKVTKNQIDYILVSHRYRNGIKNAKIRPSADCGSDHHLVMTKLEVKLKKIKKSPKKPAWNKEIPKIPCKRFEFQKNVDNHLMEHAENEHTEYGHRQWKKLQSCITEVAEEICGRRKYEKKQPWITIKILEKMNEGSKLKQHSHRRDEYKNMCKEIQRECRQDKENY